MAKSYRSLFEALLNQPYIDSHVRSVACNRIKEFLMELIQSYNIEDISEEAIEEMAVNLIDELCLEDYTYSIN